MSEHLLQQTNKSRLLYHIVCPVKYRRKVLTDTVRRSIKNVCLEIGERHEINLVEIGVNEDHVHFLVQSVPVLSPSAIVCTIKSITARKLFALHPEIKNMLRGGKFFISGLLCQHCGPECQ